MSRNARASASSRAPSSRHKDGAASKPQVLAAGKYLRLVRDDGWEYCERTQATGVVAIVVVADGRLILTEQYRKAVGCRVLDLPAGLAGDIPGGESEELAVAAQRELLEEVGYSARRMVRLAGCPTSPGLTSEIVTFFRAVGVKQAGTGGGDASESIHIRAVPLRTATAWLKRQAAAGLLIDAKVFAGLYFAKG